MNEPELDYRSTTPNLVGAHASCPFRSGDVPSLDTNSGVLIAKHLGLKMQTELDRVPLPDAATLAQRPAELSPRSELAALTAKVIELYWRELLIHRDKSPGTGIFDYNVNVPEDSLPISPAKLRERIQAAPNANSAAEIIRYGMMVAQWGPLTWPIVEWNTYKDLKADQRVEMDGSVARIKELLGEGVAQGRSNGLFGYLRGGLTTATSTTWDLISLGPTLYKSQFGDRITVDELKDYVGHVLNIVNLLAAGDFRTFTIFSTYARLGAGDKMPGEIVPGHFKLLRTPSGLRLEATREFIEQTEARRRASGINPPSGTKLSVHGCPASHTGTAGMPSVVKQLNDWIQYLADNFYVNNVDVAH